MSSRDDLLVAHATTTKADLVFALELVETEEELDQAAHLTLLLFGVAGCASTFEERGRSWPSLHSRVSARRRALGSDHQLGDERLNAHRDSQIDRSKAPPTPRENR